MPGQLSLDQFQYKIPAGRAAWLNPYSEEMNDRQEQEATASYR